MKGLKQLFAVLLVPLAFQAAFANDEIDTSRAATRRGATNTVSTNRKKSPQSDNKINNQQTNSVSRLTNINTNDAQSRERTTTKQVSNRSGNVVNRSGATSPQKSVSARTAATVQQRAQTNTNSRVSVRTATSPKSALSRAGVAIRASNTPLTGTTRNQSRARSASLARSGTITPTIETIQSRNFSACRDVFYACMDEFCANKDSTLKRCACSSRIHEFDNAKEQLNQIEDKLLDFGQRLLTVSMDKEDAMALNTATEGEIAYAVDDTSKSKKMLDEIAKKLNTSFNDSNFDQGLNAISLSLNTDAAFDNIDSMMGASTTTKSGTDLYRAALPVCREMAMEICSSDDLDIAESGYQMAIAQDCNTVAKSYEAQTDQARAKIKESSALLDMSRLNIHQERNSDDILTCKTKMLDMLTDTTVCGTDMTKCLDITGQYIDPTTGEAFLTEKLADLNTLISRPAPDETWTKAPGNDKFVLFLQSKRIYLEPAMENCQDISAYVWDSFIEDALSQIKLAQESKLEQVRQSCTTLTTQCLNDANKSVTDFDARALSIFGVKADVTVNAMCADIKNTCTALMQSSQAPGTPSNDWTDGMTEITANKTYETILSTCREVGKNCIIRACTDISGNFGLCTNIDTSINRKSIVSRRACWAEVEQCIRDAGADTIAKIMTQEGRAPENPDDFVTYYTSNGHQYEALYGTEIAELASIASTVDETEEEPITCSTTDTNYRSIYDWSTGQTFNNAFDWQTYRLTEQIWGNCETAPTTELDKNSCTNRIIVNYDKNADDNSNETLLSWFARNTNTANISDSCRDTTCGYGMTDVDGRCVDAKDFTQDGKYCPTDTNGFTRININRTSNCCSVQYDENAEPIGTTCCVDGTIQVSASTYTEYSAAKNSDGTYVDASARTSICKTDQSVSDEAELALSTNDVDYYCAGGNVSYKDNKLTCDGTWVTIDRTTGHMYKTPTTAVSKTFRYEKNAAPTSFNDTAPLDGAMVGTPNR